MAAMLVSTWSCLISRTYIHSRLESDFTDLLNGCQSKLQARVALNSCVSAFDISHV
jgi:hypothetical protein